MITVNLMRPALCPQCQKRPRVTPRFGRAYTEAELRLCCVCGWNSRMHAARDERVSDPPNAARANQRCAAGCGIRLVEQSRVVCRKCIESGVEPPARVMWGLWAARRCA